MTWFKSICHIFTIGGAIIAAYTLYYTMQTASSAIQEASGAAYAIAFVVIPYCFARAVEQLAGR